MKWSFLLFSSLLCLQVFAQYPATGNKARLGWQTTGDGLVYRGAIGDTVTLDPSGLNNAWMLLDTASGNLFAYRAKAWRLVSGGGGSGSIGMPFDSVTFNVNENDASLRELKYSEEKGYLQYGGQDSVQIPLLPGVWYVRNDTSVTIPKGTVVRASGTLGASGRIKVKHMIANGSIDAMYILGIVMQDIAVGADGYVMTQGKIRQFNTLAYNEGAVLYADVDTLGGLTQTEPGNGYLKLPIAFVVHSASNGTLAVRVNPGSYLRDLHDVDTTGKVDGSVLRYDSTAGYWKASTTAGIVAGDTSVFVRQYQLSGTSGYLPRYTSDTTIGNSVMYQHSGNIGINSTTATNNKFQIGSVGSSGYAGNDLAIGNGTQAMAIEVASNRTNFATNTYFFMQPFSQNTADSSLTVDGNFRVAGGAGFGRAVRIGTQSSFLVNPTLGLMVNGNASRSDFTSWIYSNSSSIQDATVLRVGGSDNWNTDKEESIDLGFNRISSYYQGSNKWGLKFYTYPNATFTSGNVLTFNGDGNVGIATTTPAYRLDVNGDVNTTGMYKKSGTDIISGTTNHLAMFTGANTVGNSPLYNVANNQFIIGHTASGTGAKNTLEIRGTGNTDLDGSKVDLYVNSSGQDYHAPIISLRRSRSATAGAFTKADNGDWLGQLLFNGADGDEYTGGALIRAIVDGTTGNNDMPASLLFATTPDGSSTQTERMRITSAGNVGIGNTSPVSGSGGGLTIGSPSAGKGLHLYPSGSGLFMYPSGSSNPSFQMGSSDADSSILYYNYFNYSHKFFTTNVERFRISHTGNVGIGTASPARPLHVAGTSAIRIPVGNLAQRGTSDNGDIRIRTDTASMEYYSGAWQTVAPMARVPQIGLANRFSKFDANGLLDTSAVLTQSNGRIGIGVASPTQALHVASDILVNGMRLGRGSFNISTNLALGVNALNAVDAVTGSNNVAIGSNTLLSNTNTANNIAIGEAALRNYNVSVVDAFGRGNNTAIGGSALTSLVKDSIGFAVAGNTAIGGSAMIFTKHSNENTAIGVNAMRHSEGQTNVAIGNGAMLSREAYPSTPRPAGAPRYRKKINDNTVIGAAALQNFGEWTIDTTTITNNVVIGRSAVNTVSDTSRNTTLVNSVYIGAYSTSSTIVSPYNNVTNEIAIGYQAAGRGSNTTTIGNSSTTATYIPAGKMYIGGTTAPTATLHVNGSLSRNAPVTVTANYTVAETVSWIVCDGTATIALTLPAAASWTGREIMVKTIQPYTVTSASANVVPIDGVAATNAILPATDGAWATLVSDGTNWIIMQQK